MKRDLITHFSYLIAFFILISLFKGWISISYVTFWIGGVIGTILPDLDHLIYIYVTRPNEAASQKAAALITEKKYTKGWDLLIATSTERTNLIFHKASFQLIFLVFTFLIITSASSALGRGIVLAFVLHLVVDMATDFFERKNLSNWFDNFPISLDGEQKKWYFFVNILLVLIFGFLF
ncbi:hypothetical protein A2955_02985 [Candidatus Woesebacteria bacterium RIFCSPLOWO2_01_FULL_37_19]|uniref:Uncharacterized protein n=2 Tax=Candidatus Woeseibacteriota TaxID=1752722 RepID=A0A1F8BBJ5_9BACT|nr:MAG: hypothetical protein A2771_00140 [Candidatus Woesebacteria bacterium RIFCSPHIGHO2_01_FULL_38_26b]OGM61426.1 MAG: hypothetical protein A2955_02985 [Candidatus Woesebacteria bacterium RIFCSPLOWO2_01_FULL_37_19]